MDLEPGSGGSFPSSFTVVGDRLMFTALSFSDNSFGRSRLWTSDGTPEGTRLLFGSESERGAGSLQGAGSHALFVSSTARQAEIWRTDGSQEGTRVLVRLPIPGKSSDPYLLTRHQENLGFIAPGEDGRADLWYSDGSESGTSPIGLPHRLFGDFYQAISTLGRLFLQGPAGLYESSGPGFSPRLLFENDLGDFAVRGNQMFFSHDDRNVGREPWTFDLGTGRSKLLYNVNPGFELDDHDIRVPKPSWPDLCTVFKNRVFFIAGISDLNRELWVSNGTPEGTQEILVGTVPQAAPRLFTAAGMTLYFAAMTPETGWELWASDGTRSGTRLVRDINPGPESSLPQDFRAVKGKLMFSANDGLHGHEVWISDGTPEGTQLISDIGPGAIASFPAEFTSLGEEVFFSADRPNVGRELFAVSAAPLTQRCQPSERRLCLQNGRIGVEVDWHNQRNGERGVGHALSFSDDTGTFWFFDAANVELVVKALDGRLNNESFWFFSGGLSDVKYWITATDFETGRSLTFDNPAGNICGQADIESLEDSELFPTNVSILNYHPFRSSLPPFTAISATGETCPVSPGALLLQDGRFAVEVDWQSSRSGGRSGQGTAIPATDKSGYFWFFQPENLELVVKILDGRSSNGKFWFLWGALSDVGYQLKVTDTTTCQVRTYTHSEGNLCGGADTQAF